MKFLYILISFALVNVLVALDEYTKQVIRTNQQMSDTKTTLQYLIQDFVLCKLFTIVELGIIFAVPEAEDNELKNYIKRKQNENNPIKDYILHKKIYYQKIVQENIMARTRIPAHRIDEGKFRNVNLIDLGNERRQLTLEAIRLLIHEVINGENRNFRKFSDMCCLIGLYRSINDPASFIINTELNTIGFCRLVDKNGNDIKYCTALGIIWELRGLDRILLSSQVQPEVQPERQPEIQSEIQSEIQPQAQ